MDCATDCIALCINVKIQTLTAENFRDVNQLLQWPCMRKQKFEELELSNLPEDCDQAFVHGVVT